MNSKAFGASFLYRIDFSCLLLYGRSHKIASGEHYSHHVSPSIAQNYTMLSYKKIPLKHFISHIDSLYHEFYIKIIFDVLILCLLTAKYSCSGFLELCIFWQSLEVTLEIFFKTLILPVIFLAILMFTFNKIKYLLLRKMNRSLDWCIYARFSSFFAC